MIWWSNKYGKPLKDPILLSYSLEELMYEYYLHNEREAFELEKVKEEADKIEIEKLDEAYAWADEEEARELEELERNNPYQDDLEWMNEQIDGAETIFDDFGEDLSIDFDQGD